MYRQIHQYDPTIGYRFVPGLRVRLKNDATGYLLRANQLGFRSEREFVEKKAEGVYRILLFGDSFTAGDSVSNPDRYGDRLEESLPGVEVYNFGLPGTGTDQQYLAWREFGRRFEYDLLLIGVFVENIRRVVSRYRAYEDGDGKRLLFARPYFTLGAAEELTLHQVPVPRQPIDGAGLAAEETAGDRVWWWRDEPVTGYDDPNGAEWRLMRAILRQWTMEAKKPTVICPLPLREHIEGTAEAHSYAARFRELGAWPNVTVHDPLPDFRRAATTERRDYRFETDIHWTPAGHRVLAESLARTLRTFAPRASPRPRSPARRPVHVLGISALYHDSAAALVSDGEIAAAAQEERFTRKKHDPRFPTRAISFCLEQAFIEPRDLSAVVFYDNPLLTLDRAMKSLLTVAPRGEEQWMAAARSTLGVKLFVGEKIREALGADVPVLFARHHLSHAASAFYPSPFERAAILTMDGVGEWATTSLGRGHGGEVEILEEIRYPHSLGLLYSAFTYHCGFKVNSGEYKLMGLAPYGKPVYAELIREKLVAFKPDGSFRLDTRYFGFLDSDVMTTERFDALFGGPARAQESRITRRELDMAASVQLVIEEAVLALARRARERTGEKNLVLAGGVALNCVANGKLARAGIFEGLWIQPASGDAGGALGAALVATHRHFHVPRRLGSAGRDAQHGSYLGPAYSSSEIRAFLERAGHTHCPYEHVPDSRERARRIAQALADGKVVGVLQGRMEFGPRALGARSILGDPRRADTQVLMNLKIKHRESFRPFAPSVLADRARAYFDLEAESPYMLLVAPVQEGRRKPFELPDAATGDPDLLESVRAARSDVPAITHVDYSARVQTVSADDHVDYHAILTAFEELTGCAVVVNTSFNVRGEPIVCSPRDAYLCFMRTDIDLLVLEDCLLTKSAQPPLDGDSDWRLLHVLD